MTTFVDTSALFALLDEDDANHATASAGLTRLRDEDLVTHAYILVETLALVSRRLGWGAVERILDAIIPLIAVFPVEHSIHEEALRVYREAASNRVSFVDRTSFTFMRAQRLETAFAFDVDFTTAGFELIS